MKMKEENKTVALGTSKINYMDPRITVAFCKTYELPIEKIFNKVRTGACRAVTAGIASHKRTHMNFTFQMVYIHR